MVSFETEVIFDTGKVEKERRKWKREGADWLCERERKERHQNAFSKTYEQHRRVTILHLMYLTRN